MIKASLIKSAQQSQDIESLNSMECFHFISEPKGNISSLHYERMCLYKGAGSFHIHRKTMKELGALAVLGIRERPNLAQNLVTHRH